MSNNAMHPLLDATSREAKLFLTDFFKQLDSPSAKAPLSITESTTIVWNGNPLVGPAAFTEMLKNGVRSRHEMTGWDVHPFPNGNEQAINMMINVSGKAKLGVEKNYHNDFAFSAQMVVRRVQPGMPLILYTMSYRLVHKPKQSTIVV